MENPTSKTHEVLHDSLKRSSLAFSKFESEDNAIALVNVIFKTICHADITIRESSFVTLQKFFKPLQRHQAHVAPHLTKIVKGQFYHDCTDLFSLGKHTGILKVISTTIILLRKELHRECVLQKVSSLLLKCFNSGPGIVICALVSWKVLIQNLALDLDFLTKKIDFIFHPLFYLKSANANIYPILKDMFWFSIICFKDRLSDNFERIVFPVLEYFLSTTLKFDTVSEFHTSSGLECATEILFRILEHQDNAIEPSVRINIGKLTCPVNICVLFRHFKEILKSAKIIFSSLGKDKNYEPLLSALFSSLLHLLAQEHKTTENIQHVALALSSVVDLLNEAVQHQYWSSSLCSVCLRKFMDFPPALLSLKYFPINGSGTSMTNIAETLVSLMLQPHILSGLKADKSAIKQIVSTSITQSHLPLTIVQITICQLRKVDVNSILSSEELVNIWSAVATSLLETVARTGQVNEGGNNHCDFSCFYAVLTYPLLYFMPPKIFQRNFQRVQKLWAELVKTIHMNASLIPAVKEGTILNELCEKIIPIIKKGTLENEFYFQSICVLLQVLIEHTYTVNEERNKDASDECIMLFQRPESLGNATEITNLIVLLLEKFHRIVSSVKVEPVNSFQITKYISKLISILDLAQSFVTRLKNSKLIFQVMSNIADPVACIFTIRHLNKDVTSFLNAKLEAFWQILTTTIRHNYKGPYDENTLYILTPLFEVTLAHPRRNIVEKSRLFWLATFALVQPPVQCSYSLKQALIKAKVPGHTETRNNSAIFDEIANSGSLSQLSLDCTAIIALPKQDSVKEKKAVSKVKFTLSRLNKNRPKPNIDEIPEEEFVKITSAVPVRITKPRRMKRSFVPAMYNDLSKSFSNSLFELSQQSDFDKSSKDDLLHDGRVASPVKKMAMINNIPITVKEENNAQSCSNLLGKEIEFCNEPIVHTVSSNISPTNEVPISRAKRRKPAIPVKSSNRKKFAKKKKLNDVAETAKIATSNDLKLAIRDSIRKEKLKRNASERLLYKSNAKCDRKKKRRTSLTNVKKTSDSRMLRGTLKKKRKSDIISVA